MIPLKNDFCLREKRKPVKRNHAAPQGKIQKSDWREYQGNGSFRPSESAIDSSSTESSPEVGSQDPKEEEIVMDKAIKSVKKSLDKKMDKLVKQDIKRDHKCERAEKLAKKKK